MEKIRDFPYFVSETLNQSKTLRDIDSRYPMTPFRTYRDPLEAEALIEILQKHNIPFERTFEKPSVHNQGNFDYVGSNPFDSDIVIKIPKSDFSKMEVLLKKD
ncbi:hypothetical protein [Reichenbachiella sp.]|uniref:hypothetical protein n=1 Tax=Reichenbachiella sp. TaxID=2184521 RepID=UPI003B5C24E6